jgi:glycosyltransferase involved in cell wall biosynthesis
MDKLLFITNSFGMGGAEKVLVDIAAALKNSFEVHILVFHNRGPLKKEMEKHCPIYTLFTSSLHYLLFRKISPYRRYRINSFVLKNGYKAVVGFMEGKSTDLLTDISAHVQKIAWVHSDFRKLGIMLDTKKAGEVYKKFDTIVFVSGDAKMAFFERFPQVHSNYKVIYNIIDEDCITRKSQAYAIEPNEKFTFLNVGMHRKEKCQDRLVRIAGRLRDLGYDFQIQLIGDGPLHSYLSELITATGVQDCVFLLGLKDNPYPYMKACDCFVLPSDYEGYGIAVKEALFLKKLILTTSVVGPREILENGRFGLIVDNDEEAIFHMMRHILDLRRENREVEVMYNVKDYVGDDVRIREQLEALFATCS